MNIKTRRVLLGAGLFAAVLITAVLLSVTMFHSSDFNYFHLEGFKKEAPASIDVILIGDSDIHNSFAPGLAYKQHGITSFTYSASFVGVNLWRSITKTVTQTQTPKLLVVDIHGTFNNLAENMDEYPIHYVFDAMPSSINKEEELAYVFGEKSYDPASYLYPEFFYRGINSISLQNLREYWMLRTEKVLPLRCYIYADAAGEKEANRKICPGLEHGIDSESERYLRDYLDFCKTNGYEVLFIRTPDLFIDTDEMTEYVRAIIEDSGFRFLDLNKQLENMNFDVNTDLRDNQHVTLYGQEKITGFIFDYIAREYDMPPTTLSDKAKELWEYSADCYDIYYAYAEECMNAGTPMGLEDSPEFVGYLKQRLREEGLSQ